MAAAGPRSASAGTRDRGYASLGVLDLEVQVVGSSNGATTRSWADHGLGLSSEVIEGPEDWDSRSVYFPGSRSRVTMTVAVVDAVSLVAGCRCGRTAGALRRQGVLVTFLRWLRILAMLPQRSIEHHRRVPGREASTKRRAQSSAAQTRTR